MMTSIARVGLFFCIAGIISCSSDQDSDGDKLFDQGKYDAAVAAYTEDLEYNPNNLVLLYNRGRAYEELEQFEAAKSDYEAALEIDKFFRDAYLSLGNLAFRKENWSRAADEYKKATELDDANATSFLLYGRSLAKLSKLDEAIEAYTKAISLDKQMGSAYLNRGIAYYSWGQKARACSDFEKANNYNDPNAERALTEYCR